MKKRFLLTLMIFFTVLCCAFGFVACGGGDDDSISLNHENITMEVGESIWLEVTSNSDKAIEWQTSNFAYASVGNGMVTAKKAGTVTITAIQGKSKATCRIVIKESSISLNYTRVNLKVGEYIALKVNSNSNENVKWKSSNLTIATVSSIGWVTAKKAGTVTITATQGNAKATCVITVK